MHGEARGAQARRHVVHTHVRAVAGQAGRLLSPGAPLVAKTLLCRLRLPHEGRQRRLWVRAAAKHDGAAG